MPNGDYTHNPQPISRTIDFSAQEQRAADAAFQTLAAASPQYTTLNRAIVRLNNGTVEYIYTEASPTDVFLGIQEIQEQAVEEDRSALTVFISQEGRGLIGIDLLQLDTIEFDGHTDTVVLAPIVAAHVTQVAELKYQAGLQELLETLSQNGFSPTGRNLLGNFSA
jgi:hypothetical protein